MTVGDAGMTVGDVSYSTLLIRCVTVGDVGMMVGFQKGLIGHGKERV